MAVLPFENIIHNFYYALEDDHKTDIFSDISIIASVLF